MKVDLEFDIETLRIRDLGEETTAPGSFVKKPSILESIKPQSRVSEATGDSEVVDIQTGEISKVTADVQSARLKQLLGQLKTG